MSARATTWVWQYSKAKGIDRLVMLAIADEASDTGRFASSVMTLARKSGVDARTVQRALHRLYELEELSKPLEGQRGPRGTYVYRVLFDDRPQAVTPGRESPPAESHPRQAASTKTGQEGAAESPPPAERRTSSTKNKEKTATQSSAPRTRKRTPRDDVWDAVVKVCGITEVTKSLSGQIASSVQQLCDVGAIPGQVHVRAQRYGLKYPGAALTPTALAKHWGLLGEGYIPPVQSRDFRAERVQQVADANAWMNHQGTA